MEPRRETINDREAFEKAFPPREGSSPVIQWSEENNCYTVDGVEAPIPISAVEGVTNNEELESPSQVRESSKRKRTIRDEEFFFKLFKFPNAEEQYLLEIYDEVNTDVIDRYRVFFCEMNGRWNVKVHDLVLGDHIVRRVLHDPTIPIFHKKYEIPLTDRLIKWSREKRQRDNGREDKYYLHRKRQFRSFNEVITFIIYSCRVRDLIKVNRTNKALHEVPEFEADEEMTTISVLNVTRNSFRK